ncbi:MAG: hypothetical protein JRG73_05410 [Deltaproteobacteria bacterium]|nr:hypothetical protein [Deltaproteobacteria bacterium]MBW2306357.1 hypothetical protein [Deltaproteobacteria bacterium]
MSFSLADISKYRDLADVQYEVHMEDWLREGWRMFASNVGSFMGITVIMIAAGIVVGLTGIGKLGLGVIIVPLAAGVGLSCLQHLRGGGFGFQDFFQGFRQFVQLALYGLVTNIAIMVGMILLIVPGVYLMVAYFFGWLLVADKGIDFWRAMEVSRVVAHKRWFSLFGFLLVLMLINIIGAIPLGLGLLITIPWTLCASTKAYHDVFDQPPRVKEPETVQPIHPGR